MLSPSVLLKAAVISKNVHDGLY